MLEAESHRLILKLVQERSIVSVGRPGGNHRRFRCHGAARHQRAGRGGQGQAHSRRRGGDDVRAMKPHLVGMPFALSRDVAVPQKRAIARAAAELIEDGESIIINAGTTTLALMEFLAERQLDMLTNSIPIMTGCTRPAAIASSVPGGTIFREQNIIFSPFEATPWRASGAEAVHRVLWTEPHRNDGGRSADRAGADATAEAHRTGDRDGRQPQAAAALADHRAAGTHHTLVTDDGASEEELEAFGRPA